MIDKEIRKPNPNPVLRLVNKIARVFKKPSQVPPQRTVASWQDTKIVVSPEITRYLEKRHVSEDEVKQVIYRAETTKEKIFQPDSSRFLAKSRIGKATIYVEYHQSSGDFVIDSAYAHKSEITG